MAKMFGDVKKVVPGLKEYSIPTVYDSKGWRSRFREVETWAAGNPWDNPTPDPKELKLCVAELFEAIHMATEGFKFCSNKNGTIEALTAAKELAIILES